MPKVVYVCSDCGKSYDSEAKALACEEAHDSERKRKEKLKAEKEARLEAIRAHFGKQVSITSGYRTPEHNAKIGGAVKSQHMIGLAADIKIPGVKPSDIASYARTLMPTYGGIGIYSTFTHIDVRDKISNWKE